MASLAMPNLAPEPVEGDSLTQYLRSLTNYGGTTAPSLVNAGQSGVATGTGTLSTSLATLQGPKQYFSDILSGNPTAISSAIAPQANLINSQYDAAKRGASMLPRGGFRSSVQAGLPFQQAAQVGNLANNLLPTAAAGLAGISGLEAGIGGQQGNLGLGETQSGQNILNSILQALIGRRGQNTQQNISNLTNLTSGLTSVANGATSAFSDRRLKRHIRQIGEYLGIPVYRFKYLWDDVEHVGVMAQEAYEIKPEAVIVGGVDPWQDPWLVDYGKLLEVV